MKLIAVTGFRYFAFFLSQYAWVAIGLVFLCIGAFLKNEHSVGLIHSASRKFDPSLDPILLMHVSDAHINAKEKGLIKKDQLRKAFELFNVWNPAALFLSGDIVDNKDITDYDIAYGDQHEADFLMYKDLLNSTNINLSKLYDIAGNHDEYGVGSFDSSVHYLRKYANYYNAFDINSLKDFWVSRVETDDFELFILDPFWFPVPHAKLAFDISPDSDFLDTVEDKFKQYPRLTESTKPRIVMCHFPLQRWINNKKSSSKKTINDIVQENNVSIFISGHMHPSHATIDHHGETLEVICPDLKSHKRFGLITVDNGNVVYHDMPLVLYGEEAALVTYPVPKDQLSSQVSFNDKNAELRVIVLSDADDIHLVVNGLINGTLKKVRTIFNGYSLLSIPFPPDIPEGDHEVFISGDFHMSVRFTVGPTANLNWKEKYFANPHWRGVVYAALALSWIGLFIATLPIKYKIGDIVDRWILSDNNDPNQIKYYLISIFCGPLVMNSRISRLPAFYRVFLFALVLYPTFLPLIFINVEHYIGIIWTYGYIIGGSLNFDYWGQKYCCLYVTVFLLPLVLFSSAATMPFHPILIFDLIVFLTGIGSTAFFNFYFVVEAVNVVLAILSPAFSLLPLVAVVWIAYFIFRGRKKMFRLRYNILLDTTKNDYINLN